MLRHRGEAAGLPGLHPHQLRHTFAHQWLSQGGGETDLMRLAGWRSRRCCTATAPRPPTSAPARPTAASHRATGCGGQPLLVLETDQLNTTAADVQQHNSR
jgi:hypothetical protein